MKLVQRLRQLFALSCLLCMTIVYSATLSRRFVRAVHTVTTRDQMLDNWRRIAWQRGHQIRTELAADHELRARQVSVDRWYDRLAARKVVLFRQKAQQWMGIAAPLWVPLPSMITVLSVGSALSIPMPAVGELGWWIPLACLNMASSAYAYRALDQLPKRKEESELLEKQLVKARKEAIATIMLLSEAERQRLEHWEKIHALVAVDSISAIKNPDELCDKAATVYPDIDQTALRQTLSDSVGQDAYILSSFLELQGKKGSATRC